MIGFTPIIKDYVKSRLGFRTTTVLAGLLTKIKISLRHMMDILFFPLIVISAIVFRYIRKNSFSGFTVSKLVMLKIGVYPIIDHYYEPLFNKKHLRYSLRVDRNLPGINMNDNEQLQILSQFNYCDELLEFPLQKTSNKREFCYNEGPFRSGDAEYLYNMIRLFKPRKYIEVGSGSSTLMAINAITRNKLEDKKYDCDITCIEPFENDWLESLGVRVIRKKVEEVDRKIFKDLDRNDILFIDSSHIIRPQGDILFLYLEILPTLNKGVIVHIHDIFTPRDYLDEWVGENFWNEQYLLEAFLTNNKEFRIIGATNYLSHKYREQFAAKCPVYKMQHGREPGSF